MRLPRWTVWPALAILAAFLVPAVPRRGADPLAGAAAARRGALPPARYPRMVVLGIDGMDPEILAEVLERHPERTKNLRELVDEGGLHSLGTSCPPQSPVAWSSFITGLDPGGHGIFDFIHRDPVTRGPQPSTTTPVEDEAFALPGEWQFPLSSGGESNRSGAAFWELLAQAGVPADVWRMPANFPVVPAKGLSFSGMMTPALDSAYGQYTLYTTDPPVESGVTGGKIEPVRLYGGRILTRVIGPPNPFKEGYPPVSVPITIHVDREARAAAIDTGERVLVVPLGGWSEFVELDFAFLPGPLAFLLDLASHGTGSVKGVVRFYLRSIEPEFELYASPVNIDPLAPPAAAPVSAPSGASAEVAEEIGIYYTQGMPEDVNALKTRVLDDGEFMQQSALVHEEGLRMLDWALEHWTAKPEGGLLFFYFSGVDLCGHMMWRHQDREHPHHDPAWAARDSSRWSGRPGSTWGEVIDDLYLHVDEIVGRVRERVGADTSFVLMSDHGFAPYRRKFSLNTWLLEQGYLVLKEGRERERPFDDPAHQPVYIMDAVDWSRTRAYGVGFNGLYLNLAGRERDDPRTPEDESGIVPPSEARALLEELRAKLLAAVDDEHGGRRPVLRCDLAEEVYRGARVPEAPDMLVGYDAGYGNSDPASLGRIPSRVLEDNLGGTFNGSHLMAPEVVAGILLTNGRVLAGEHRLEDLTVDILRQYGVEPGPGMRGRPVLER
jgi:predicted AlkP superfamily phosphohydrolase/phosphomutase